jgi:hypothetical protein
MRPHRTVTPKSRLWRSAASTLRVGVGALFAAGGVSGCSVLYDLSTEQCKTTADCVALGGAFETLECRENLCQEPLFTGCHTNAECIDTEGEGSIPYACIEKTGPNDKECVPLQTTECPLLLPQTNDLGMENLRSDEDGKEPLILAGTAEILQNPFDGKGFRNYDLALAELSGAMGGLKFGDRPLVMIGCKANVASSDELDALMSHVVGDLKVPGMVTAFSAEDLQNAWSNKGKDAKTFFMSTQDSDPALAILPDDGLMWHVGPGADVIAWAYAPLLTRTLAHLAVTGDVRVATVAANDARFLATTAGTIEGPIAAHGLQFNGKSVAENRDDGNYRTFTVSIGEPASTAVAQALVDFRPHVIISADGPEFYTNIMAGVERLWGPTDTQAKPFYILSAYNYNDSRLANVLLTNSTARTRIAGVNVAAAVDKTNYNAYTGAWDAAFSDMVGVRDYENYYDAAYYLMFAAAAAARNSDVSTGSTMGDGMKALLSGPAENVGRLNISPAMQFLANGNITLNGTMGPPDFDPLNGTRRTPGSVFCVNSGPTFAPDVLRYSQPDENDAASATLSGTFPCIPDF